MPERWCAICVLVMRVIGLGILVPKFYAFVVGCRARVVSGGVYLVLGLSCVRVLEMCAVDVVSLKCEFGWAVVG